MIQPDKNQTTPENERIHICDFSRGVLNVRFTRSHPTLASRSQIWILSFSGVCLLAVGVISDIWSLWKEPEQLFFAFDPLTLQEEN